MELNKSNQSIGGDSSSDLAKSQWDETKVNDKVDVASSAIDQDKDTEVEKSADKAKASRLKKLVASVAIGLTLAVSGGVHAYQQHVENQRVAEAAREEQEQELEQANQRRQEYLDQVPDNDLSRDKYVYNEADRALGRDVDSSGARVLSPAEFEEYFHVTPETYQMLCLEKYGINADDFADDTETEAQQRFDRAKQEKDEYEAELKARREAFERRGRGPEPEWEKPPFTDAELQALQNGDVSYFKKSKESKVKQALNARIRELGWAKAGKEAIRQQQLDQTEANDADPEDDGNRQVEYRKNDDGGDGGNGGPKGYNDGKQYSIDMDDSDVRPQGKEVDKSDRSSWSDDEIGHRERAYYEHESEQRNREEIQIVDLQ